jgi:hypothetical protein
MDIQQLRALGAISPRALVPKKVEFRYPVPLPEAEWTDPEVPSYPDEPEWREGHLDTFIRKRSASDAYELLRAEAREHAVYGVLRGVCNADGSPVFSSFEQVDGLADWLFWPLVVAVNEVNRGGPKRSAPRTKSGATSPSPSGAARSRSGKRRSPRKSG